MPAREPITRAAYVEFHDVATRWGDNDAYGHLNNVIYYACFDTVIIRRLVNAGGLDPARGEVVAYVVRTQCEFVSPVGFPEPLSVGLRLGSLGRTSVRYELAVFRKDRQHASAVGEFVHVYVQRATGRPVAIPPEHRACLESLRVITPAASRIEAGAAKG